MAIKLVAIKKISSHNSWSSKKCRAFSSTSSASNSPFLAKDDHRCFPYCFLTPNYLRIHAQGRLLKIIAQRVSSSASNLQYNCFYSINAYYLCWKQNMREIATVRNGHWDNWENLKEIAFESTMGHFNFLFLNGIKSQFGKSIKSFFECYAQLFNWVINYNKSQW